MAVGDVKSLVKYFVSEGKGHCFSEVVDDYVWKDNCLLVCVKDGGVNFHYVRLFKDYAHFEITELSEKV